MKIGRVVCGRLEMPTYGTRDAAQNWEEEHAETLTGLGLKQGKYSPCVFYHPEQEIRVVVHGDDFTILGRNKALDWLRKEMGKQMEIKYKERLERNKRGSVKILNRIATVTKGGLEYEADQRHAGITVKEMGLKENNRGVGSQECTRAQISAGRKKKKDDI